MDPITLLKYWKEGLFAILLIATGYLYFRLEYVKHDRDEKATQLTQAGNEIIQLQSQAILINKVTTEERQKSDTRNQQTLSFQKEIANDVSTDCGVSPVLSNLLNSLHERTH